jgi:hypothetical protein
MGRCGGDAQLRGSETKPVVIFTLATHTHFKNQETGLYSINQTFKKAEFTKSYII